MSLDANATTLMPSDPTTPVVAADFHTFVAALFSLTALQDWLKLFVIGGLIEAIRRYLSSFRDAIRRTFWITANFDSRTDVYRAYHDFASMIEMLICR